MSFKKIFKEYIKSFFYSDNKPQPTYYYAFIFLHTAFFSVVWLLYKEGPSISLSSVLIGIVVALITLYKVKK
jgi:hypothetical protein